MTRSDIGTVVIMGPPSRATLRLVRGIATTAAMNGLDAPSRLAPHALREYALVADGERGALIGPRGDVAWMCVPRWDSDAPFNGLIGGSGHYTVTPSGRFVWGGYYEPGTLIWRLRWVTETGIVECREALAFPADLHRAVLLRRVIAVDGDADVSVALAPAVDFGQASATPRAPFCSAVSSWRSPPTGRAPPPPQSAGSSATGRPAVHLACSPRSTTSLSDSCAAIFPRPSCTPCCSNPPQSSPHRRPRIRSACEPRHRAAARRWAVC
jgi:hypothetical protein